MNMKQRRVTNTDGEKENETNREGRNREGRLIQNQIKSNQLYLETRYPKKINQLCL